MRTHVSPGQKIEARCERKIRSPRQSKRKMQVVYSLRKKSDSDFLETTKEVLKGANEDRKIRSPPGLKKKDSVFPMGMFRRENSNLKQSDRIGGQGLIIANQKPPNQKNNEPQPHPNTHTTNSLVTTNYPSEQMQKIRMGVPPGEKKKEIRKRRFTLQHPRHKKNQDSPEGEWGKSHWTLRRRKRR